MYLLETEKLFKGSVSLDLGISLYPMKEPSLQSWKYLGLQFLMYSPKNKIKKKKGYYDQEEGGQQKKGGKNGCALWREWLLLRLKGAFEN